MSKSPEERERNSLAKAIGDEIGDSSLVVALNALVERLDVIAGHCVESESEKRFGLIKEYAGLIYTQLDVPGPVAVDKAINLADLVIKATTVIEK